MSLYGDLPAAKNETSAIKTGKFVPAFKLPERKPLAQPIVKKESAFKATAVPRVLGVPRAMALKHGAPEAKTHVRSSEAVVSTLSGNEVIETVVKRGQEVVEDLVSNEHLEYNPARPNDYEEYCMERDRKRKEAAVKRSLEDYKSRQQASSGPPEKKLDLKISGEDAFARRAAMNKGGALADAKVEKAAPPPEKKLDLKLSGDDAFARRQAMSVQTQKGVGQSTPPLAAPPVKVEIAKPPPPKAAVPPPAATVTPTAAEKKDDKPKMPPSRVILLRNMVGQGEVDQDLVNEITDECAKFGPVLKTKVHEMVDTSDTQDVVRIFVQFSTITSATKAVKVMNGRFFAGRTVKGSHYPEGKFHKDELNDPV